MKRKTTEISAAGSPYDNTTDRVVASVQIFSKLPDEARVRLPVVVSLFACSPATVWRCVNQRRIPAPRKCGRMTYWTAGELRAALRGESAT